MSAESSPTRNDAMRFKYGIRTILVAASLFASYIALYRALTVPEIILSESAGGTGIGYRDPNFRFGGSLTKLAFLPATFIDQRIRPDFWNSYCTLDDVRTVTDYPWGYVDCIDGCANSLSLNANSSRSVDAAMEILTRSRDVNTITINVVGGCSILAVTSSARGRRDARRDIADGRLINKISHGRLSDDAYHIRKVLEDEYGIDTEIVINDEQYRSAYRSVMNPKIYSEHGQTFAQSFAERTWAL